MQEIKKVKGLVGAVFVFAVFAVATTIFVSSLLRFRSKQMVLGKKGKNFGCTTIQSGQLQTSDGNTITPGFDQWGYNYQARIFNGGYCDAYRDANWCQPYKDVELTMKWNDAWLSNKDCDNDGFLDRHYGFPSYIGSGAWLTNHMHASYIGDDEKEHNWTYFVKIVAAPADAELSDGAWYSSEGELIGPEIWGEFVIIEQIYNDPYGGSTGVEFLSPSGPGFGKF